mmetsp:Transcript_28006/g.38558  ORF Transcript_28006/g.38558 Transcript_28006/m.38558 type:complete len:169 (+) Transcript_28006:18-524(+)
MWIVLTIILLICVCTINIWSFPKNQPLHIKSNLYRCYCKATQDDNKCGPCPLAPKCSGEYSEKGCDGTGKIQGGIATVPLLSWWPIKVYRPCPSYLAAGYQYRREGQTMDQVLFSEPSTKMKERMEQIRIKNELDEQQQKVDDVPIEAMKSETDEVIEALWNERKQNK